MSMNMASNPPVLQSLLVLLVWTGTSFLCHISGKAFLTKLSAITNLQKEYFDSHIWVIKTCHALILTAIQLVFCSSLVKMHTDSSHSTLSRVAKVGHALATFATNFSMAAMFASSTFAIKLMEPITSALVQYLALGTPMSTVSIISLPVIVGGAIVFAGNPLEYSNTSWGTLAALTSNFILAFRNVAIKKMSNQGSSPLQLEMSQGNMIWAVVLSIFLSSIGLLLEIKQMVPQGSSLALTLVLVSAIFHVTYSYVSTGMVLTKISVVSHAVANILKRVLVVLLLYAFGQRVASANNFLGLVCCTVGLLVYAWDKRQQKGTTLDAGLQGKGLHMRGLGSCKMLPKMLVTAIGLFVASSLLVSNGQVGVTIKKYQQMAVNQHASGHRKLFTVNHSETFNNTVSEKGAPFSQHFSRSTFLANGMQRPTDEELQPILDDFQSQEVADIKSFLKKRIIEDPRNGNFLSAKLTQTSEVIREAQRLHFNILQDALKRFKYAMIFDLAAFENKGDPCITVGEMYFLKRINLPIIYYCNYAACNQKNMEQARVLARKYTVDNLVILIHGGGNIIGYPANDRIRFRLFKIFGEFEKFIFPQSIFMKKENESHIKQTIENYCCRPNLTIVLRDHISYDIARNLYNGSTRLLMAPDMAFQIGHVERFISPVFDILWLKREDRETPGYKIPQNVPKNIRVHVSDWWRWITPNASNNLERAFYIAANGFFFLQRGRVIVTDRLHGHILSTLMDIPHVVIDNKYKKLSGYHLTWTKSLENTIITSDPTQALDLAIGLLKKYNDTLPPIVPFLDIDENFKPIEYGKPIVGYP